MKNLTKIIFLTICLCSFMRYAGAQCTPDNNTANWSINPYDLPPAFVNVPYSETLSFKAGSDTTVKFSGQDVLVKIDSMKVTGVRGLPAGFSYACHNASCRVLGGQAGCAIVTGTPTVRGYFPLTVYITIWGKAQLFVPFPITQNDSIERYALDIDWATGISSIKDQEKLNIYPNPASKILHVESHNANTKIVITDLHGRTVYSILATQGTTDVNIETLSKGIYIVSLINPNGIRRQKISVE